VRRSVCAEAAPGFADLFCKTIPSASWFSLHSNRTERWTSLLRRWASDEFRAAVVPSSITLKNKRVGSVKRHPELLTGRHDELTPMVLADVKQAASERALK
jgi:hypothetical protein